MMTVAIAADLVRWFQLPAWTAPGSTPDRRPCPGGIFHTPGRLVRRARQRMYASSTVGPAPTHTRASGPSAHVRIIDGWPGSDALLDAYRRIDLLT
jgi:hypothetical protein